MHTHMNIYIYIYTYTYIYTYINKYTCLRGGARARHRRRVAPSARPEGGGGGKLYRGVCIYTYEKLHIYIYIYKVLKRERDEREFRIGASV